MGENQVTIIAVTGSHGTGKTTYSYEVAQKLKMDKPFLKVGLLSENVIHCPFPINGNTTICSQRWIFTNQLQAELDYISKYDLVISDRSVVDAIAYTAVAGFSSEARAMLEMAKLHIVLYDRLYFKTVKNNPFMFEDKLRESKDKKFRLDIEKSLLELYNILDLQDKIDYC